MLIDGITLKEKHESNTNYRDGKENTISVVTRSIGDKVYQVKTIMEGTNRHTPASRIVHVVIKNFAVITLCIGMHW